MPPRKRKLSEIGQLAEPTFSSPQRNQWVVGIELFNRERYWEAHEAWENVWLAMTDDPVDDGEILLRGLIQFAAGLHALSQGKVTGARSNLTKSMKKLALGTESFQGIALHDLAAAIESSINSLEDLAGFQIPYPLEEPDGV